MLSIWKVERDISCTFSGLAKDCFNIHMLLHHFLSSSCIHFQETIAVSFTVLQNDAEFIARFSPFEVKMTDDGKTLVDLKSIGRPTNQKSMTATVR